VLTAALLALAEDGTANVAVFLPIAYKAITTNESLIYHLY